MALVFTESIHGTKEGILESLHETARKHGPVGYYCHFVEFPLFDDTEEFPLSCREPPDEFEVFNSVFNASIHNLFDALHDFEQLSKIHDGDGLIKKEGLQLQIDIVKQSAACGRCYHRSFLPHSLFLREPAALPQLQSVTKLHIHPDRSGGSDNVIHEDVRPVALRVLLELMTRLPALSELDCPWLWEHMPAAFTLRPFRHFCWPWAGLWRDSRHEFGAAVQQLHDQLPSSLTKARLWFWMPNGFFSDDNQGLHLPDLIRPAEADPLSLGLRTLASHLEDLDLRAILTPDLFCSPLVWPRMKKLRVEFHPWSPDGTWYFVGPRGENPYPEGGYQIIPEEHYPPVGHQEEDDRMDEEFDDIQHGDYEFESQEAAEEPEKQFDTDVFRIEPFQEKLEPLLSAFAAALKGMPALEEAELFTYLGWRPSIERKAEYEDIDEEPFNRARRAIYRWGVSYKYAPGKDSAAGKRQVTWQVGAWRPWESVAQLFDALGCDNRSVETQWKPFKYMTIRRHPELGDWDS
ncbi:hypothetical protein DV738_g1687, partial [Chaetothyriales sp. CBS 135597]